MSDLRRTLSEAHAGEVCRVESVTASPEHTARMAGLGVSVGRQLRIVRMGEPMVVQIYGSRIGLARTVAGQIGVSFEAAACTPEQAEVE